MVVNRPMRVGWGGASRVHRTRNYASLLLLLARAGPGPASVLCGLSRAGPEKGLEFAGLAEMFLAHAHLYS